MTGQGNIGIGYYAGGSIAATASRCVIIGNNCDINADVDDSLSLMNYIMGSGLGQSTAVLGI